MMAVVYFMNLKLFDAKLKVSCPLCIVGFTTRQLGRESARVLNVGTGEFFN